MIPTDQQRTTSARAPKKPPLFKYDPKRSAEYLGVVNYATTERVIEEITRLYRERPNGEIFLTVTSAGGPTGTAMSFFDHMQYILRPHLVTIGSGDVDSSGILIFLSGMKRYITKNTTLLFHPAGRIFEGGKRFTAREIEAMAREDNLKDYQYACVVADASNGRLTPEAVLDLMDKHAILTGNEMVAYGLAHAVIE